eukprot:746570-Hanusia_phi.AAC.1
MFVVARVSESYMSLCKLREGGSSWRECGILARERLQKGEPGEVSECQDPGIRGVVYLRGRGSCCKNGY